MTAIGDDTDRAAGAGLPHRPHGSARPDPGMIDVQTLRGRRAVQRWERTSVGDLFERLTWSRPDQVAIAAAEGRTPTEQELVEFCRQRLAGYETPKGIVFADALPETVGGKVEKYKLRAQHAGLFV